MTPEGVAREWALDLSQDPSPEQLRVMTEVARTSLSVAERLAHHLHPWASFVIIPLFALANAGVELDSEAVGRAAGSRVAIGIVVGLVVGKLVGISAFSWLAVRLGVGALPGGVSWRQLMGISAVAGIGFTVSLFVTDLAFEQEELQASAKIGVLGASSLAAVSGAVLLWRAQSEPDASEAG